MMIDATTAKAGSPVAALRSTLWGRFRKTILAIRVNRTPRRLRLCESVSLGEKRVVAVIQYETQKFLVGAGAHSVSLLARLGEDRDFSELLTEWCERER